MPKRALPKSLLSKRGRSLNHDGATSEIPSVDITEVPAPFSEAEHQVIEPSSGGAGSAWQAGTTALIEHELDRHREALIEKILTGKHEIELNPSQITDSIGTDRRPDWQEREEFQSLQDSIRENGQDTPIQVWPAESTWRPDNLNPEDVEPVPFLLITGRRRLAVAVILGRKVRAVIQSNRTDNPDDDRYQMLAMRFRENEKRQNLSAFERLVSIGELFDSFKATKRDGRPTAVAFASQIGVHESMVSRGRALIGIKKKILHTCNDVYALSNRDLEKLIKEHSGKALSRPTPVVRPNPIKISRQVNGKRLSITSTGGHLSIRSSGLLLDEQEVQAVGDALESILKQRQTS